MTDIDGMGPLLPDKIALITGGGGGIGEATSQLFAAHGAHVVIAEIDEARGEAVAKAIRESGGSATAIPTDVRDVAQITALRDTVLREHGRLDILVNNVGHHVKFWANWTDSDPDVWQQLYEINVLHVFRLCHLFLPSMIERRSGNIINVSSVEGARGYPQDPVYGAFKAAVIHFTRSLGVHVGDLGVRVNGIAPDLTETISISYPREDERLYPVWSPVGRLGVPLDQARVLLFLASDLSSFVLGTSILTDGGTGNNGGWYRTDRFPGRKKFTAKPIDP
jgi:NAD(P)-dependent dehydrogenase (short-subunit alcohol dehydrogenase family)